MVGLGRDPLSWGVWLGFGAGGYLVRVSWRLVVIWGGSHRGLGSCLGRALAALGRLYGEDLLGAWGYLGGVSQLSREGFRGVGVLLGRV